MAILDLIDHRWHDVLTQRHPRNQLELEAVIASRAIGKAFRARAYALQAALQNLRAANIPPQTCSFLLTSSLTHSHEAACDDALFCGTQNGHAPSIDCNSLNSRRFFPCVQGFWCRPACLEKQSKRMPVARREARHSRPSFVRRRALQLQPNTRVSRGGIVCVCMYLSMYVCMGAT